MYKTIPEHFPGAVSITDLETQLITELVQRTYKLQSVIWATSFCSDEVNNLFSPFYDLFAGPGPFRLGGISGLPFSGITGMNAFLSHIPTHGAAMILYGPHIGVSRNGTIGQVQRQNQPTPTTCCGSLVAALESLKDTDLMPTDNPLDYQQSRVQQHLFRHKKDILDHSYPLKKATDIAYEAIHVKLFKIIDEMKKNYQHFELILAGGVVINTDWTIEDYFDLRNLEFIRF